jgi:signal transduction histidine kinase
MTLDPGPAWLRWLPADSRAGLRRRFLIVWAVAAVIALLQRYVNPAQHPLDQALVYSYAISTAIWFLADPLRIVLRRWLRTEGPYYWSFNARSLLHQLLSALLGYTLGAALGDLYAGHSTWQQLWLSPQRFWGFLLWSMGVSAGFLFFFYHREKAHALEQLATETRLKLLESQLEPHMLFNTLANLRVLIKLDPDRATAMLDRLNDYLRATLSASRSDGSSAPHTLALEFQRLRDYLELMAVRMGPRLRYTLDLPDHLATHPVPPLLLQPLVENAIRHGLEPSVEGGEIEVSARSDAGALLLTVKDTGVGCEGPPASGFGTAQVRERLATAFGTQGQLQWTSAPGEGTRISLRLPLQHATA